MSTKTSVKSIEVKPASLVTKYLREASGAEHTMLEKAKLAAQEAAKEFNPKAKPADNVRFIQSTYKEELAKCGQSTQRYFASFLLLLAAPVNTPVEYKEKGATVTTSAAEIAAKPDISARTLQAAAQTAKESLGIVKAPRGKQVTKAAEPTSTTAHAANAVEAALNKAAIEAQFWKTFDEKAHSSGELAKIVARLEELGYKVTKAAAKAPAAKASAPRPDAAKAIAAQLSA